MKQITDQELLAICLLEIEDRLAWGSSNQWHNEVYNELSKTILNETNVLLSPTTLKRVWGKVSYNSKPSINTLNTLAKMAGYTNWLDFKNKVGPSQPEIPKKYIQKTPIKILALTVSGILLLVLLFSAIKANRSLVHKEVIPEMEFSSRTITKGIPNSVIFDLDLKGVDSDSMYIQQFWDETKTVKLKPGQSQATGLYYFPGYYRAKLLIDGIIAKEHDLFIKSEGWLGTIDYEPVPKYFEESMLSDNNLVLPNEALKEIKASDEPLISSFHYIDDFGEISGDNFILQTSFRNIYNDKWAVCSSTRIAILGTEGVMLIPLSIPGCVSNIGLLISEKFLSGKEHDLSMFGTDLSQFVNLNISVEDKHVKILLNDELKYSDTYHESIGKLTGLRFRFLGAGQITSVSIKNLINDKYALDKTFQASPK